MWRFSFALVLAAGEEGCQPSRVVLSNGVEVPRVGLGTAGRMGSATIAVALAAGVRLIDTARAREWYDEDAAAEAVQRFLRERNLSRGDVVVVTKVHPRDHGRLACAAAVNDSARKFDGYADVILLHYPICWSELCGEGWRTEGHWRDSWRALEDAVRRGAARAIGVSNFGLSELEELENMAEIGPHVVQNWMDPFRQDRQVREWCRVRGVAYTSYSTLGTQWRRNPVASSGVLAEIAASRASTPFAVALSWALQRGALVVPRSFSSTHIRANARMFDSDGYLRPCLSGEELARVDALDGTARDGEHSERVTAVFEADSLTHLFWLDPEADEERHVATLQPQRGPQSVETTRGHVFRARSVPEGRLLAVLAVAASPGETQYFHITEDIQDEELR